jgi:hypothetical protein
MAKLLYMRSFPNGKSVVDYVNGSAPTQPRLPQADIQTLFYNYVVGIWNLVFWWDTAAHGGDLPPNSPGINTGNAEGG